MFVKIMFLEVCIVFLLIQASKKNKYWKAFDNLK